jgi:hypothetical protein
MCDYPPALGADMRDYPPNFRGVNITPGFQIDPYGEVLWRWNSVKQTCSLTIRPFRAQVHSVGTHAAGIPVRNHRQACSIC